jgi:hypothetical protein
VSRFGRRSAAQTSGYIAPHGRGKEAPMQETSPISASDYVAAAIMIIAMILFGISYYNGFLGSSILSSLLALVSFGIWYRANK